MSPVRRDDNVVSACDGVAAVLPNLLVDTQPLYGNHTTSAAAAMARSPKPVRTVLDISELVADRGVQ